MDEFAEDRTGSTTDSTESLIRTGAIPRQRVGPYRLMRVLGRGGMGEVFLAERADGQFEQTVALKIVTGGASSEDNFRRFRQERQIVASLHHPNIARLLDGGITEQGQPYFAMEYVDGQPINQYCDEAQLSIPERLRLFQVVGHAVHHAHRNLLVHRDLKPNNIFVTQSGEVKLLDFGIAKLLNEEAQELAPDTRTDALWMTPEYASPEQLHDQPLTTASDQYQLGLLLFELLTGRRTYRLTQRSLVEVVQAVCEDPPPAPSTVAVQPVTNAVDKHGSKPPSPEELGRARGTSPQRLRRALRGDLDAIVLKTLAKKPGDRYASVEQLVEDVGRYLDGLPVFACAGSLGYRIGKFVVRNRFAVVAAFAFLLLLSGYTVTVTLQKRQIALERDRAEAVKSFLVDLFTQADPGENNGQEVTARQLLGRGARQLTKELDEQPEVRAELRHVIGRIYTRLGAHDQAAPLLAQALAEGRRIYGENDLRVAQLLNDLAMLELDRGAYDEAEILHRQSLAIRLQILGEENPKVSGSLHNLARALEIQGRYEEAENLLRRALEIDRQVYGSDNHRDVSYDLNSLGKVLALHGHHQEAEEKLLRALEIRQRVFGDRHLEVAGSLRPLAVLALQRGDVVGTLEHIAKALEIDREALGNLHWKVGEDLLIQGRAHLLAEDWKSAEAPLTEAEEILHRSLGRNHRLSALATAYVGVVLRSQGKITEAVMHQADALTTLEGALPQQHPEVADVLFELGRSLREYGEVESAREHLERALKVRKQIFGFEDPRVEKIEKELATWG